MLAKTAETERRPLREVIASQLRDEIVSGLLPAGGSLAQEEVAQRFGVSQTPVREAFKTLEAEGLVDYVPYKGVQVVGFTAEDIGYLFGFREILETAAVRDAAARLRKSTLDELEDTVAHMRTLQRPAQASERRAANVKFHSLIWGPVSSRLLVRLLKSVWSLIPDSLVYEGIRARQPKQWKEWIERDDESHQEILDALRRGDVDGAVEATRDHTRNAAQEMSVVLGFGDGWNAQLAALGQVRTDD